MTTGNKRLLWQHLTTLVIDNIRRMTVKGVKLKSESFFLISPGVLELWRKSAHPPPGMDMVKEILVKEILDIRPRRLYGPIALVITKLAIT